MQIPKNYPYAIGVALLMSWQAWREGLIISKLRGTLFNQEFMKKEFGDIHKRELDHEIPAGGYPDTGNGVYSQKLSYRDWYKLNVYQRIHLNYVESMSLAQVSLLSSALYKPKQAAVIGLCYVVGRALYSFFYKKKGGARHKGRIAGFGLCMLAVFVNSGIFFANLIKQMRE